MKKIIFSLSAIVLVLLAIFFLFIPVFQGKIFINPVVNLVLLQFHWYGLIMAIAILLGFYLARHHAWRFGISAEGLEDYSFWLVIVGIIGARFYYAIFNYDYFFHNLSEIYKIWHGGLSIYGGILAGLMFTYLYARNKAYGFYQLFDLVALSLPLSQAIGRLGNFINQEAFGPPTNVPWKMYVTEEFRPARYAQSNYFHPAFLYEIIFDVLIFFILQKIMSRAKGGVIGFAYLMLYSTARFFIEPFRLDSFFVYGFRVDQVMALLIFTLSLALIYRRQHGIIG